MEIKEHDRKVIRHTPVCSLMCCVKPSYAGLRSGTHFIISIPLISVFFSFSIFINLFLVHFSVVHVCKSRPYVFKHPLCEGLPPN